MDVERRVTVRGLIQKDGKLFAQKLHGTDYWCTPGGGIDSLESLHDALVREMIEETGVEPVIGRLVLIQQFLAKGDTSHGDTEQLEFFFLIDNVDDYQTINLEETTHGVQEIAEFGFIDPRAENLLPKILQTDAFLDSLTHEQPVQFYADL